MEQQALCNVMKEIYDKGWIAPYDGNVSFRNKEWDCFLITPAGVNKSKIKDTDIVMMDIIEGGYKKAYDDEPNPSGEVELHYKLLMKNPDENRFVVHCHPPNILAFMGVMNDYRDGDRLNNLTSYFPELGIHIGEDVPFICARSKELAESVLHSFSYDDKYEIVGLKQHGIVCIGSDLERIMNVIETVEYYCAIAVKIRHNIKS